MMGVSVNSMAKKILIILLIIAILVCVRAFNLQNYLTLDYLNQTKDKFTQLYSTHGVIVLFCFMAIYIVVATLSIPGATILTLAGGAIFGRSLGTLAVSIASTSGATLACLIARYLLRDWVQNRLGKKLNPLNNGIEREGAFYLFTLRLVPVFPFFLINLAMGLTKIRISTYFFVSMIGMLPGTFVYVNAGTELAKVNSIKGILSPNLILAFVLLGILPLTLKKFLDFFRKDKVALNGV